MKILVVGCGSIGRRHAANAAAIAEVAVMDADLHRAAECGGAIGVSIFPTLDAALAWQPDGVVVATPHRTHVDVASRALAAGADVLVEKPVSHDLASAIQLLQTQQRYGRRVYVVCNMRFHPGPSAIKSAIAEVGKPLYVRAHYGNFLPDMRPNADYRSLYASQRAEGGGVILDAIHEIDYLSWLFGSVAAVQCYADKLSNLDIDVEDFAALTLRHRTGVVSNVQLDYLRRFKSRGCEVVGDNGTLIWHSDGKKPERSVARLYRASSGAWETLHEIDSVDGNEPYRRLMDEFVGAVRTKRSATLLDADTAVQELRVALSAQRAMQSHRLEQVEI